MAYFPHSALSGLVALTTLDPDTSIEYLRLSYDVERNRAVIDVHDTFGKEILDQLIVPNSKSQDAPKIQLLFLSSIRDHRGVTTSQLRVEGETLEAISSMFRMPFPFWDAVLIPNPWSKQSGASFHRHSDRGLEAIEGFYHYFNEWDKGPLHVWFKYNVQSEAITYVLVDCPEDVKSTILASAQDPDECFLHQPFVIDLLIAEQCAAWREVFINRHYKEIFDWHEDDGSMEMDPPLKDEILSKKGLQKLHQLSRTWNMIYEDLNDFGERLDALLDAALKLQPLLQANQSRAIDTQSAVEAVKFPIGAYGRRARDTQSAVEAIEFIRARNCVRRRWVTSFGERTKLIIGFVFSLASQKNGETNVDIANLTSIIAEETRQDNSSMITIATMTMVFLPGTFICAVFSMIFFDSGIDSNGNEYFRVSPRWWYFPATALPCTLFVIAIYYLWRQNREGRMVKKRARANSLADPEKLAENMV